MTTILLLCTACYVGGSVNWSVLLLRAAGARDPREVASGNPGASNVYRTAGPFAAVTVLLLDLLRAGAAALAARALVSPDLQPLAGLALILGNRFPLFHGFRGGKGVANYLGYTFATAPLLAAIGGGVWLLVYALVRAPFLGSFAMLAVLAAGNLLAGSPDPLAVAATLATAALIAVAHRSNVVRHLERC